MPSLRSVLSALPLVGFVALATTTACSTSHAPEDAGPPAPADAPPGADARAIEAVDAGPPPACGPRDLSVVEGLGWVRGSALSSSGEAWGVTFAYGRFERFVVVDGATGAVTTAVEGAAVGTSSIGTSEGFLVVHGTDAIYVDSRGAERGRVALPGSLAVGHRGYVPIAHGGDRIYLWLTVGADRAVRLFALPPSPPTATPGVTHIPLSLDRAPLAAAFGPGGRALLIEGEPDAFVDSPRRVRELVVSEREIVTVSDEDFAGGFTAFADAASDGEEWIVSGAERTPGTRDFTARLVRLAAGRTEVVDLVDPPLTYEGVRGALLVEPDGTLHATFSDPHDASTIAHVVGSGSSARSVEPIGDASYTTDPRIARSAGGCVGVLVGVGASGTMAEGALAIRLLPAR